MAYSFAVDRLINKLTNRFNISKAFFKVPKLKLGNFPCFPPTVVSETDRPEHWLNSGAISWLDTGITVYITWLIYICPSTFLFFQIWLFCNMAGKTGKIHKNTCISQLYCPFSCLLQDIYWTIHVCAQIQTELKIWNEKTFQQKLHTHFPYMWYFK